MAGTFLGRLAAVLLFGAGAAFIAQPVAAAKRWGADYFPNVPLVNQDGATVRFYDDVIKGKSVAINLVYTSCKDECPLETARMLKLQRILGDRMGKDIFFYSISIDPETDTPAVLKAYMAKFGVGPGWQFLTGTEANIKLVAKKLGLSRSADLINVDGHSSSLMVGNEPAGQWMRHSASDNPEFLAASIGNFLGWKSTKPRESYVAARAPAIGKGEFIFRSRCSSCHTIGNGRAIGPDLLGVTERREHAWLARYIQVPDRVLAARDPLAVALSKEFKGITMPNLGLGAQDVADLLSFLEQRPGKAQGESHEHAHHHHHHEAHVSPDRASASVR